MLLRCLVVILALGSFSCGGCDRASHASPEATPVKGPTVLEADPADFPDAGNWARNVVVSADPRAPGGRHKGPLLPDAHPAVMTDDVEDSDEPVLVGRLVYRVSLDVPGIFRDRRATVEAPAGELHIDLTRTRLRARFVGPGWPVPEGSEIRLRADLPGVYVFDATGGRSLGAGQLASWFEGLREGRKIMTRVAVRKDWGPRAEGPLAGHMICALLAEWSDQPREALAYRCKDDSLPPGFRVGPWSGELTAVVPLQLARRTLRADEVDRPRPMPVERPAHPTLEGSALAGLVPSRAEPGPKSSTLTVQNDSSSRALIIAQGVPVGWADEGGSLTVDGFAPGYYRIGALRPLGIMRMAPKLIRVPGRLVIGRGIDPDPPVPPATASPDAGPAPSAPPPSSAAAP